MALKLETSWLQQGSAGLIKAIDHLTLVLAQIEMVPFSYPAEIQEVAGKFTNYQEAIMREFIKSSDATSDLIPLTKFLEMFHIMWHYKKYISSKSMKKFWNTLAFEKTKMPSKEEIYQIVNLWTNTSDETVLNIFRSYFDFLWTCMRDNDVGQAVLINQFCVSRPVISAADVRWYFPLVTCPRLRDDLFVICLLDIPNLLPTIIASTTYLVNCWWLIYQADLVVASNFIKEKVSRLIMFIRWFLQLKQDQDRYELFCSGLSRLLRCVTFAIVMGVDSWGTMEPLTTFLLKSLKLRSEQLEKYSSTKRIANAFAMLSRDEMGFLLDCFNGETKKCSFFKDDKMKEELQMVMKIEDELSPLSRTDADILFLPDYVKDAINSLSRKAICVPKVGVYALIDQNKKRIPDNEWTKRILKELKSILKGTPILSVLK